MNIPEREIAAARRFVARLKTISNSPDQSARALHIPEATIAAMAAGNMRLPFGKAILAAKQYGINLLWLESGQGDPHHALPSGLAFLDTEDNAAKGFCEVFDAHLADVAARLGTDRCALTLFRAMERSKVALATGQMSPEQEAVLRAAVAPWLN